MAGAAIVIAMAARTIPGTFMVCSGWVGDLDPATGRCGSGNRPPRSRHSYRRKIPAQSARAGDLHRCRLRNFRGFELQLPSLDRAWPRAARARRPPTRAVFRHLYSDTGPAAKHVACRSKRSQPILGRSSRRTHATNWLVIGNGVRGGGGDGRRAVGGGANGQDNDDHRNGRACSDISQVDNVKGSVTGIVPDRQGLGTYEVSPERPEDVYAEPHAGYDESVTPSKRLHNS